MEEEEEVVAVVVVMALTWGAAVKYMTSQWHTTVAHTSHMEVATAVTDLQVRLLARTNMCRLRYTDSEHPGTDKNAAG